MHYTLHTSLLYLIVHTLAVLNVGCKLKGEGVDIDKCECIEGYEIGLGQNTCIGMTCFYFYTYIILYMIN